MASIRAATLRSLPLLSLSTTFSLLALAPAVPAQCLSWSPGFGPGPNGLTGLAGGDPNIHCLLVHDDGSGPALYAGGQFESAGGSLSHSIARWDGTHWSGLAGGASAAGFVVYAMCRFDDGSGPALYAGGSFHGIGGTGAQHIARWDGSAWSAIDSGETYGFAMYEGIAGLCGFDDGSGNALYAVGDFYRIGGTLADGVARWDGAQWSPVGGGLASTPASQIRCGVTALAFDDGSGSRLFLGGRFNHAGAANVRGIAAWDGASWSDVGGGFRDASGGDFGAVSALCVFDDGSGPALYAGGSFAQAGGQPAANVARWDGHAWSSVGAGLPSADVHGVTALTVFDDGSGAALYAAGPGTRGVLRWSGSAWTALSGGAFTSPNTNADAVQCLASFDDGLGGGPSLFAGGYFNRIGTLASTGIAEWRGCHASPASFCAGDGGEIECPCGNNGLAGRGCQNSAGTGGALLAATGTTNPDTLVLNTSGMLASAPAIVLQGDQAIGFVPFGDGLRCIGGHLKRLYVAVASSGATSVPAPGQPSISARSAALGDPLAPGAVRFYQTQYRDPVASFCPRGGTFNASSALRVVW